MTLENISLINFYESILPDRVSNPVSLTPQSDALPTALRDLAESIKGGDKPCTLEVIKKKL